MKAFLYPIRLLFISIVFIGLSFNGFSTHLRAGEITVERVNCSLTFKITITVYLDTEHGVQFGGYNLYFGDGHSEFIEDMATTPRPDLGEHMGTATFTTFHTYGGPGQYKITYSEEFRNEHVVNIPNSILTPFSISTFLNFEVTSGCNNNTPKLLVAPIDRACSGVAFFHNPGAYDPDGDSLSYEIVVPARAPGSSVIGYADPNDPKFYLGDYNTANEDGDGSPEFYINQDGTLTWDAPGVQGEYNVAFIIKEWRKNRVTGVWEVISYVTRDMQIIVEDCDNERPDLIIPNDTCVEAGTVLNATIFGIDPENHPVKIEAFSEIFNFAPAQKPATFSPKPPVFRPSDPPAELTFEWNTDCIHIKEQPYQVVFKITDDPPDGPKLVTFKTWNITVVGPAPVWESAEADYAKRHAILGWDDYTCQNAETIHVWRRIGEFDYTPDNCETGMPEFLGYELIDTVPAGQSDYVDTNNGNGLAPGAQYCYRLVAIFPHPKGGESYVSKDTCIGPILADAPVITHVTIDKTSLEDGEITISWRNPFDIDKTQFPEPYQYEVYRANGFAGTSEILKVSDILFGDTTFTDVGMNTEELIFNYRIVLYSRTLSNPSVYEPVDTSAVASTIRLDAESEEAKVNLSWSALVPWSNQTQLFPYHLIYRGPGGSTEDDLILIDSVNVSLEGLNYLDDGSFNNMPLEKDKEYCYRVMTRGSYGNPDIAEPLNNFSQIVCVYPNVDSPPCKPELFVQITDCEKFFQTAPCGTTNFSNTIYWNRPASAACRSDIRSYNIYAAKEETGSFELIEPNVRDTFFMDANLSSFARCYRITAVDRSGRESEMSDPVCNDNCPYYELPNIFTPNDDGCNDRFSAYYDPGSDTSGEESGCPVADKSRCARFVEHVTFKVYNRWGKEVYTYKSGSENSIYIEWDGRNDSRTELATGIYYYIADVLFHTSDPKKRNQTFKGWVHLLR